MFDLEVTYCEFAAEKQEAGWKSLLPSYCLILTAPASRVSIITQISKEDDMFVKQNHIIYVRIKIDLPMCDPVDPGAEAGEEAG